MDTLISTGLAHRRPRPTVSPGVMIGTITRVEFDGRVYVTIPALSTTTYHHGPMRTPAGAALGSDVLIGTLIPEGDLIVVAVLT